MVAILIAAGYAISIGVSGESIMKIVIFGVLIMAASLVQAANLNNNQLNQTNDAIPAQQQLLNQMQNQQVEQQGLLQQQLQMQHYQQQQSLNQQLNDDSRRLQRNQP